MPNFIIAYHGGRKPESPEEGAAQMAKWKAWIDDLGAAVVNPGTPLGKSTFLNADGLLDGTEPTPLTGFSVVKADDIDAALAMAKLCPFLEIGTLEVAEMMEM